MKTIFLIALLLSSLIRASFAFAQGTIEFNADKNSPPKPVESPLVSKADLMQLRQLNCIKHIGGYRSMRTVVTSVSGVEKPAILRTVDAEAMRALGWSFVKANKNQKTSEVFITESFLSSLGFTKIDNLALDEVIKVMQPAGAQAIQPPKSKIFISGLIRSEGAMTLPESLLVKQGEVFFEAGTLFDQNSKFREAIPPTIVMNFGDNDPKRCAAQIEPIVDAWRIRTKLNVKLRLN